MISVVRVLEPWLALLGLYALFELPDLVFGEPLRPTAEIALLLAAYVASLRLGTRGRALRITVGVCAVLLCVYRLDRTLLLAFMKQEPPLYDQLFMARLLFVLIGDLWSWKVALGVCAFVLAVVLLVRLCRALLRRVREFGTRPVEVGAVCILALATCVSAGVQARPPQGAVQSGPRWITPVLLANITRSRALYATVQRQLNRSPYRFDLLRLQRRPDIYLFVVESYGRVLWEREQLRGSFRAHLRQTEQRLTAAGWHAASGFSTAPISGGGSWLADASLLTGMRIDGEAVFHHVMGQMHRVPNLVALLGAQGYHTIALAPADRKRLGVKEVNYYGYQRQIRHEDLRYTGPNVGWGIIPDQYSLGFTDEQVLRHAPRPLFLSFHMVSSHTPWDPVPTLVDDWRTLNRSQAEPVAAGIGSATLFRLRAFGDHTPPLTSERDLNTSMLQRYQQTLEYDLQLLERYLTTLEGDALVVVMGDHQPPLISGRNFGFETPVHLLSKDPALLQEFKAHGFKAGLELTEHDPAAARHEGLLSLLVRTLALTCSDGSFVPPYLPAGARP